MKEEEKPNRISEILDVMHEKTEITHRLAEFGGEITPPFAKIETILSDILSELKKITSFLEKK